MAKIEVFILDALRAPLKRRRVRVLEPTDTELPDKGDFVTMGLTFAPPRRVMLANSKKQDRRGTLILTLVSDIGQDWAVYLNEAGDLADLYREGTFLSNGPVCVEIYQAPAIQEGYQDGGRWRVPVTINWRTFA